MRIGKYNYIQQLKLRNEKALMFVINEYGGLQKIFSAERLEN